jgi:hypothetical protein
MSLLSSTHIPFTEEIKINRRRGALTFCIVFSSIAMVYGVWLLAFWPGFLGEDSLAVLLEIESNGTFHSGKPVFWYYFVKILSGPSELVEIPIAVQMMISAAIFSRILAWCLLQKMPKIFFFGLLFICFTPNMIFYAGLLYADGIYSVCVLGLLFEFWLISQRRRITHASLAVLIVAFPFAVFARANGLVFLLALIPLLLMVNKTDRWILVGLAAAWCSVVTVETHLHKPRTHSVLFPIALFETVNFLRPHPMNLWRESPRVSEAASEIITRRKPLENILADYDPDYWDTLVYKPGGPDFFRLDRKERKKIVSEFFRYNLWRNIPAFLGSRVNVFMVSALAGGGFPSLDSAKYYISRTKSKSQARAFGYVTVESILTDIYNFYFAFRWLLWTPLFGIVMTIWLAYRGWNRKLIPMLIVTLPMLVQLAGIFIFSIAGEYRYLLPYFTVPLVLLPALEMQRRQDRAKQSATPGATAMATAL